jgi:hypothetical protein
VLTIANTITNELETSDQRYLYSVNKHEKPFDKSYRADSDAIKNRLQKENIDFVKLVFQPCGGLHTPDFSSFYFKISYNMQP